MRRKHPAGLGRQDSHAGKCAARTVVIIKPLVETSAAGPSNGETSLSGLPLAQDLGLGSSTKRQCHVTSTAVCAMAE